MKPTLQESEKFMCDLYKGGTCKETSSITTLGITRVEYDDSRVLRDMDGRIGVYCMEEGCNDLVAIITPNTENAEAVLLGTFPCCTKHMDKHHDLAELHRIHLANLLSVKKGI